MGVLCPHCQHAIAVKNAKPGRYSPKCSKCGQAFLLTVPAGADERMSAALLGSAGQPASVASVASPPRGPALEATQAPSDAGPVNAHFSVAAADVAATLPNESQPPRQPVHLDLAEAGGDGEPRLAAVRREEEEDEVPAVLGNYQIVRELGRGGMGAVYLARQVSLDRLVALKVMNRRWAKSPVFVARFMREAYAAAQLVHHNVVQIYDVGTDKGINYFSMEFVEGQSLGQLLKKQGKLPPEEAAGYVLQAARGLKFAHDRGMIHRDVKPDNLMLNAQGVVKVADLGLVKTPGLEEAPLEKETAGAAAPSGKSVAGRSLASLSNITQVKQAMGTPAYMAPEQARNATAVDHRADVYSLGCTLYVLVTGRAVFQGTSALEVMTRHATDPVVRPDVIVKTVPRALSDVVLKMVAKRADDRYATTDEAIQALEDFLGLRGTAKLAASEEHVRVLEESARAFLEAPAVRLRSILLPSFLAGCAALVLLFALIGWWRFAGSFLGLGALTALACFLVRGASQRSPLFGKARELALDSGWLDWLKVGAAGLLFVGLLFLLKLFWAWLIVGVVAIGLAFALHYGLDRRIFAQRREPVERVERMLKGLRLRGLSEDALQELVCKYSGEHWEELFEALFGYEAKLLARPRWGAGPRGARPKFASWRDPIVCRIDNFRRARQEAKERRYLQAIEQKNLQAQGMGPAAAQQKAERVAEVMVQQAAEIKKAEAAPPPVFAPSPAVERAPAPVGEATTAEPARKAEPLRALPPVPRARRIDMREVLAMADEPEKGQSGRSPLAGVPGAVFGSTPRFLLGAVLLGTGLVWLHVRHLVPGAASVDEAATWTNLWSKALTEKPFDVPGVPEGLLRVLCNLNAVVAGLLLVLSAIWRSPKMGVFLIPAAVLMSAGAVLGMPEVGPLSPELLCLAAGGGLALLGFLFGRDT